MPEVDAAQLEGEAMLSDRIADLVEYLVVQIVDDPDSVSLEVIDGDDASTIDVSVAEDDVAKVIGRRGRTADRESDIQIRRRSLRRHHLDLDRFVVQRIGRC